MDVPSSLRKADKTIDFELISRQYGIPLDRMENHDTARLRFVGKVPEVKLKPRQWS